MTIGYGTVSRRATKRQRCDEREEEENELDLAHRR